MITSSAETGGFFLYVVNCDIVKSTWEKSTLQILLPLPL